jgi:hypothetical protein
LKAINSLGTTYSNDITFATKIQVCPKLNNYYTLVLSDYNGFNISCYGLSDGFIIINPTNGSSQMTYSWKGPKGFTASSLYISNLIAGQYVLTITDPTTTCSETDTFALTQPSHPLTMTKDISISVDGAYNINCNGASTGFIAVTPQNNIGLVNFKWADGAMGRERTNLQAGLYKIIITDSNNCIAESDVILTQPDPIILAFDVINSTCPGKPDGSISVNPSGGVQGSGYYYLWSDNSTARTIANIVEGAYIVIVIDMNSCSVKGSSRVESINKLCLR